MIAAELTDEELAALRAEHGRVFRVAMHRGPVEHIAIREPRREEYDPAVAKSGPTGIVEALWSFVVWPVGPDLEELRELYRGPAGVKLFHRVISRIEAAHRPRRKKKRRRRRR